MLITFEPKFDLVDAPKKTYINFRKAGWKGFEKENKDEFEMLHPPTDVHSSKPELGRIILEAATHNPLTGPIPTFKTYISLDAAKLGDKRDPLQKDPPREIRIALTLTFWSGQGQATVSDKKTRRLRGSVQLLHKQPSITTTQH